jgi:pimeloyl-ACP methyl ester carboxylesterase
MTRRQRRAAIAVGLFGVILVAIPIAANLDMARERRARRYLGDRLYTEIRGSGDPIVFLAGLQGSTRYWGTAFDDLAPSHRLIFVDALGFGRSPWPESPTTLDEQIEWLHRTLAGADATQNVTFVAHSFGTVLAAYYAQRYPAEVRRIVLLGTPSFANESEGRKRIRQMSFLAAAFTFNRTLAVAGCTTMCAFRPLLRRTLPFLRRDMPAEVVSDSVLHDLPAVDGAVFEVLLKHPIAPALRNLGARAVLIHGRRDRVTPLAGIERLVKETGAQLIVVPGDHHHYLDEINVIKQRIEEER